MLSLPLEVIELDESLFWSCRKRMGKFLRTFFRFCRIIPKSRTANRTRTPSSLFQGLKSIRDSAGCTEISRRSSLPRRNMRFFCTYSKTPTMS